MRRLLWSNTEVANESPEYTGTPLKLLLGFLVALAILIPVHAGFFLAALGLLGHYAVYRTRRYRLTCAGPEIAATGLLFAGYVVVALGFSTNYRAPVTFSLWQLGMESLQLFDLSALERVKASGGPSLPQGEGLARAAAWAALQRICTG
jgi:hypothetical protein